MHRIDGTQLATTIREQVKQRVAKLSRSPRLAVLLVGNDPASELYVSLKQKAAQELGIEVKFAHEAEDTTEATLVERITNWSHDDNIDGILIQLPLPDHLNQEVLIQAMDPRKDVDGFHPTTIETLQQGGEAMFSPLIEGCLRLIAQTPLKANGAKTSLIVNSDTFAAPFKRLLRQVGAFVTVMYPDELKREILATSDLVIIAIGRAHFLNRTMTKRDAVIIDIGTNRQPDGKVFGDADINTFEETEVWITPVPGGVGPMTIAQLLSNVTKAAELKQA